MASSTPYTCGVACGFVSGKELDAADVRYSFQQAATVTTPQQDEPAPFAFVAAIHTPEYSHTVRFLLKQSCAPFVQQAYRSVVPHCAGWHTHNRPRRPRQVQAPSKSYAFSPQKL